MRFSLVALLAYNAAFAYGLAIPKIDAMKSDVSPNRASVRELKAIFPRAPVCPPPKLEIMKANCGSSSNAKRQACSFPAKSSASTSARLSATVSAKSSVAKSVKPFSSTSAKLSATASAKPSVTKSLKPSASTSVKSSASTSVKPSASTSVKPSVPTSAKSSVKLSATKSAKPSATGASKTSSKSAQKTSGSKKNEKKISRGLDVTYNSVLDNHLAKRVDHIVSMGQIVAKRWTDGDRVLSGGFAGCTGIFMFNKAGVVLAHLSPTPKQTTGDEQDSDISDESQGQRNPDAPYFNEQDIDGAISALKRRAQSVGIDLSKDLKCGYFIEKTTPDSVRVALQQAFNSYKPLKMDKYDAEGDGADLVLDRKGGWPAKVSFWPVKVNLKNTAT